MRLIRNATFVAVACALSAMTYAADTTAATPATPIVGQTTPVANAAASNVNDAALSSQLAQLKQQIDALQQEILNGTQGKLIARAKLAKAAQALNNGYAHMALAKGVMFETMPAPTFALSVLQNRDLFADHDLIFGGYIEQDTQTWSGDSIPATNTINNQTYNYQNGSGLYLTSAKFDNLALINNWVASFVSFDGDNLTTANPTMGVEKAFLLLGQLKTSPIYGIVGQNYLPFGAFAGGGPWSAPLTRSYFRPNETTQGMLGYYKDGLSTSFAVFNNNTSSNPKNQSSDFTYDLAFSNPASAALTYSVGASFMNDLRGTSSDIGTATNVQSGRLPAYDLNASLGYEAYDLSGEYDWADHEIAGNTNLPEAWNVTGSYTPVLWDQETSFALSYSGTTSLANVPVALTADLNSVPNVIAGAQYSWVASVTREVLRGVYLGLEEATIKTYANQNTQATTLDVSVYF
jgi:hypothetical protein